MQGIRHANAKVAVRARNWSTRSSRETATTHAGKRPGRVRIRGTPETPSAHGSYDCADPSHLPIAALRVHICHPGKPDILLLDRVFFGVIVNYNTTSSITSLEIVVPNRLIHLMLLAAALSTGGAAIVALSNGALRPQSVAIHSAAPANVVMTTTLLPTVVVRPEAEVPTLATVTVRPSRADWASATAEQDEAPLGNLVAVARRTRAVSVGIGGAGFDMPYYSFGRTLRHASKE
jgi:hypothetical protein